MILDEVICSDYRVVLEECDEKFLAYSIFLPKNKITAHLVTFERVKAEQKYDKLRCLYKEVDT